MHCALHDVPAFIGGELTNGAHVKTLEARGRLGGRRPEVCWRVTTGNGYQFVCCLHGNAPDVEVRLTMGTDTLVDSRTVESIDRARRLAHRWLRLVIAVPQGGLH